MIAFVRNNGPSILWAAFILVLCLLPGRDLPSVSLWEADKLVHFLLYALWAPLLHRGWKKGGYTSLLRHPALWLSGVTFAYGFGVEIAQEMFTADRHYDVYDALANAIGGLAGSLISVKAASL